MTSIVNKKVNRERRISVNFWGQHDNSSIFLQKEIDISTADFDITEQTYKDVFADNHDGSLWFKVYVGVTGDVKGVTPMGETVLYKNLVQGNWYPMPFVKILKTASGTSATNLVIGR